MKSVIISIISTAFLACALVIYVANGKAPKSNVAGKSNIELLNEIEAKIKIMRAENDTLRAENKNLQLEVKLWKASQYSYETNLDMVIAYYSKSFDQVRFNMNNDLPITNGLLDFPCIQTIKPVLIKTDE